MFFRLTSQARRNAALPVVDPVELAVSAKPQDETGSTLLYERIALSHALADIEENAHRKFRGK